MDRLEMIIRLNRINMIATILAEPVTCTVVDGVQYPNIGDMTRKLLGQEIIKLTTEIHEELSAE